MAAIPAYAPTCSINRTASTSQTLLGVAERYRRVGHSAALGEHRHRRREPARVARIHELLDLGEGLLDPGRVERGALGHEYALLAGRPRPLVGVEELLVQLLPGAAADDLDRHVAVGLATRELDHLAREVDDPDRVAHLEHVPLAAAAELAGVDDELDRLRDRHEVARHVLVGHRDRAARGDLAPEDRHDGATRAEHVAEADRGEARLLEAVLSGLDGPLGERLRGAH